MVNHNFSPPFGESEYFLLFPITLYQLMVITVGLGCWFGILGLPLSNNPFHKGIPNIQTTNPNHQLTIGWWYFRTSMGPVFPRVSCWGHLLVTALLDDGRKGISRECWWLDFGIGIHWIYLEDHPRTDVSSYLLSQWQTFWTFGDSIFSRENKVQTFFSGSIG